MAELNGSSYYRANPYYQQGYLPDMAYKNRKIPSYMVEIPQGKDHFDPTTKKHFQRLGYNSTINNQHIMEPDNTIGSPSRDRQYFRNLHVEDIEGAGTNTLISKAVKNRMKHKEYQAEKQRVKREEEAYERMRRVQQKQQESRRMDAIGKINREKEPNYHQKVMKLKTEESDRYRSPVQAHKEEQNDRQQPTREERRPQPDRKPSQYSSQQSYQPPQHVQPQYAHPQDYSKNYHQGQYDSYKRQLQQTERQIKQLQNQLHNSRQHHRSIEQNHSHHPSAREKQYNNVQHHQSHEEMQRNIMPQTYQHDNYPPKQRASMPEKRYYQQEQAGRDHHESYRQQRDAVPRDKDSREGGNQRNSSGPISTGQKLRSVSTMNPNQMPGQQSYAPRNITSPIYDERGQIKQTRQEHRRFNPTFLSYGSPAIGLAGRNIVGY